MRVQQFSIIKVSIILLIFISLRFLLHAQKHDYPVKPVFTGMMATSTDAYKWFKDIAGWGITGWECFAPHYRAQLYNNKFT